MHRASSKLAIFAACFVSLLGFAHSASAQVEPIEPMWMIATREAPLRCGELSTFYKVTDIERNQIVRVDGRSSRWARVIYPEGLFGFVRAEEAKNVDLDNGTLTVSDISSIKAPNQISGMSGSWRSIYLGNLKPNSKLKIVGKAESKEGLLVGYRVEPPVPPVVDHLPHGYVQLAALRVAEQPEIDAFLAARRPQPETQTENKPETKPEPKPEPKPETQTENPATENTNQPEAITAPKTPQAGNSQQDNPAQPKPVRPGTEDQNADAQSAETPAETPAANPEATQPTADDSLVDDMAIPTPEDLEPAQNESTQTNPTPSDSATTTTTQQPAPQPASQAAPQVSPQQREFLRYEELEQTLTRVRRRGGKTLDDSLDELVAEYERSLPNAESPAIRNALSNRLEWLQLRKAARDQRLALQLAVEDAKQFRSDVQRERIEWQSSRGYEIVGRLIPSAIYDGENLPRMYRIVAAGEGGLTRTIGYVKDEPGMNLQMLAGDIVGVSGSATLDEALRLRIITPTRIDRFRAATVSNP